MFKEVVRSQEEVSSGVNMCIIYITNQFMRLFLR